MLEDEEEGLQRQEAVVYNPNVTSSGGVAIDLRYDQNAVGCRASESTVQCIQHAHIQAQVDD